MFEVTFSRDSIPTGGVIAGPLTADSSRVTLVYVRQSGVLVPATLKIRDDDLGVRTVSFSPEDPNDPNVLALVHSGSRTGRITLRVEDPNDRRAKQVSLSPEGEKLIEKGIEERYRWMEQLESGLSDLEKDKVNEALEILIRAVEKLEMPPTREEVP